MCFISPVSPRKKPSKKSSSRNDVSSPASKQELPARITNNATTSRSHTVELPTSYLRPYILQKAQSDASAIQTIPPSAAAPSPFRYLDQAGLYTTTSATVPACSTSTSASSSDRKYRDCVLDDIDFVQKLSEKLAPPAPSGPKGPGETEKKMQAEVQRIGDILKQKEIDNEIAAAVAKGKAEGKAEVAKKAKEQESSCNAESCACSENANQRKAEEQDGFVFHVHAHQNRVPLSGSYLCNGRVGCVDVSGAGLYETQSSGSDDAVMGGTRRIMDRLRLIEARTTFLETEMKMGWEARERRRVWEMERERYGYASTWGRGYL